MTQLSVRNGVRSHDRRVPRPACALGNSEHEAVRASRRCGKSVSAAGCFAIGDTYLAAMARRAGLATLSPRRRTLRPSLSTR
jgi:hypothetical protein